MRGKRKATAQKDEASSRDASYKEMLAVVEIISNEKGVDKSVIFGALETALASAAKKPLLGDPDVYVTIDRRSGQYKTFQRWQVIADGALLEQPDRQKWLQDALLLKKDVAVGASVEKLLENANLGGRIAAQTAKQVIVQKVRDAERAQVIDQYLHRKGELIGGVVKRLERGDVIVDVGEGVEARLGKEDLIPRESFRIGDRVRSYLMDVRFEPRGPQLFLSRISHEFLAALFHLEVPEINQGLIEIKGVAREPGTRAKVAVKSKDMRIDPIGACVGIRGTRIQNITNELLNERVDIVQWDDDPVRFVMNAMSPAEVESVVVDEDTHSMDIIVADEKQIASAIGKGGQNAKLASRLTGWALKIMSRSDAQAQRGQEETRLLQLFIGQLDVDEDIAAILVREGFASVEEVAYLPSQEMLAIVEFDEDIVEELRVRARGALLTRAIAAEEQANSDVDNDAVVDHVEEPADNAPLPSAPAGLVASSEPSTSSACAEPAEDLLQMEGMDETLACELAKGGVITMDDLAELSVDDLQQLATLDDRRAAQLIMTARAPWFAQDAQ